MDKSLFSPIQSQPINTRQVHSSKPIKSKSDFSFHFNQAIQTVNKLHVSKHASERLKQRGIHISESRWELINEKIHEAQKKGVKDSLVLLKDAALIISAKNNTVVTAMAREEANTQIFTNINGTIVME